MTDQLSLGLTRRTIRRTDGSSLRWSILAALALGSLLTFSFGPPVRGDDEPYADSATRTVSEGLASRYVSDAAVRRQGAEDLGLYGSDLREEGVPEEFVRGASAAVCAWLDAEPEPWIRHALFEALSELDPVGNRDVIASHLGDDDPTLRARAAEYLAETLTPNLEAAIVKRYAKETVWWVKTALLEALREGTSDASLAVLHDGLLDGSRDVRAAATGVLEDRADGRSVPMLMDALARGDLVGMDSPVWALGFIGDRSAAPALESAALGPHPLVRLGAAWALGRCHDPESERILATLLHDTDERVRVEAAEALGELGGEAAAFDLLSVLETSRNQRAFLALLRVSEADLGSACRRLREERADDPKASEDARDLCERAHNGSGDEGVELSSTAGSHSMLDSPADAKTREVWPEDGANAVVWDDAIGEEIGGSPTTLERGTQVTIWRPAYYKSETWLEVLIGPHGGIMWIREGDVRSIDPDSLHDTSIWRDFGAVSKMPFTTVRD